MAPTAAPVLWQFRHSHYNEKARWALDWKRVPHVRRSLLPGPHVPRVLWMTGQKSVPVLVCDGTAVADSTRIIETLERRHPETPLYPRDPTLRRRALELEDFFDEELGPHVRRTVFHSVLPDGPFTASLMSGGFSRGARRLYGWSFPLVRAVMRVDMQIDDAGAARGRAKISAALDTIRDELQPSGYLVGDGFTVADLTAAALLYPLVRPPEFPYPVPDAWPDAAERLCGAFAGHPTLAWASDMYRRHRGTSAEIA